MCSRILSLQRKSTNTILESNFPRLANNRSKTQRQTGNLSPSRYLLWAAYGSLLGGQWTLIGTRSNIVVRDFLRAETGRSFGFFDLTPVAACIFLVCALFLITWTKMAATGHAPTEGEDQLARKYLTEVMVTPASTIVGKTLDQIAWSKKHGGTRGIRTLRLLISAGHRGQFQHLRVPNLCQDGP
jgi:di/tricarboxylate transporter